MSAIHNEQNQHIIAELITAYGMEVETVQNYLANSQNLVGVRAERIKAALREDVQEELGHAQKLAHRVHVLGGVVPGSFAVTPDQAALQPPKEATDVVAVIRGVIEAETQAIEQYNKIIRLCGDVDFVTQDLCIALLRDEEDHRRRFIGYLAEYDAEVAAAEPEATEPVVA